jgi:hypothetical protein
MADLLSRRDLLHHSAALGAFVAFGTAACHKPAPLSCTDTSSLSLQDVQVRTALAYADSSADPAKVCMNCQQFLPAPVAGSCGTCKVVKGPINPGGNCKSFVAKTA